MPNGRDHVRANNAPVRDSGYRPSIPSATHTNTFATLPAIPMKRRLKSLRVYICWLQRNSSSLASAPNNLQAGHREETSVAFAKAASSICVLRRSWVFDLHSTFAIMTNGTIRVRCLWRLLGVGGISRPERCISAGRLPVCHEGSKIAASRTWYQVLWLRLSEEIYRVWEKPMSQLTLTCSRLK